VTQRLFGPGGGQAPNSFGRCIRASSRLAYLVAVLLACLPVASPADVRPEVGSALALVKSFMQQRDYEGAQGALHAVERMRDLNGHESAQVLDLYGSIYQAQGRYGLSIRAYETVLAQEDIPDALAARAARALADLHAAQNNPVKALEYLNQWATLSAPAGVQAQRAARPRPGPRPTLSSSGAPALNSAPPSDQFVPDLDEFKMPRYTGDYKPIVRVSPAYPRKAVTEGLEGHVVIECTISKTGSVMDAKVVESTNPVFDRAALKAVKKYKYPQRMMNGEYVEVTGVRNKITFKLE